MPRPAARNGGAHVHQASAAAPAAAPILGSYFEALRVNDDRTPMIPAPLGFTTHLWGRTGERIMLSALARALYDNGGFPGYAVNQIAFYCSSVWPQADTRDPGWNMAAELFFEDWSKRCDFSGRPEVDLSALETVVCQSLDLDGDIGSILTLENGWPQVQLIEGYRIGPVRRGEAGVIDGLKLDSKGRLLGYQIDVGNGQTVDVSVNQMTLVREASAANPFRGLSSLRRGMNDIRDARDILAFEKLAVKHLSSMVGVVEGGYMEEDSGFDLTKTDEELETNPDTPSNLPKDPKLSKAEMLGGDIPILPEGRKFSRVEANRPNAGFADFQAMLIGWFAAGLDIPPAFFLDSKLTGPNQRAVIGKAQRKFDSRQDAIARWVGWLWVRVIGWAIDTGQLPAADGWQRCRFQFPAKLTIDAGRDAMQEREDVARGLMTRQGHYGNRSEDWQRGHDQIEAEITDIAERSARIASKFGLPLTMVLQSFGIGAGSGSQPAQPAAETEDQARPDNTGDSEDTTEETP